MLFVVAVVVVDVVEADAAGLFDGSTDARDLFDDGAELLPFVIDGFLSEFNADDGPLLPAPAGDEVKSGLTSSSIF